MTHKVGATVQVAAKQGSQFDGQVGRVTKRLTKDSAAVRIADRPELPALMFGDNELVPFIGVRGFEPLTPVDEDGGLGNFDSDGDESTIFPDTTPDREDWGRDELEDDDEDA